MNDLKGKILAITRSSEDSKEFLQMVSSKGGTGLPLPTIEITPAHPEAARSFLDVLRSKRHEYCAFMSAQAVEAVLGRAENQEIKSALEQTRIVAVGPKTRTKLEEFGLRVEFVPTEFSSKGLAKMFSNMNPSGKKIIIPRSAAAGDYAAGALRSLGMEVDEISLYSVRTSELTDEWKRFSALLQENKIDAIIFTSASSVTSFFEILANLGQELDLNRATEIISIGPFTSEALRKRKIECHESTIHTVRGALELATTVLTK